MESNDYIDDPEIITRIKRRLAAIQEQFPNEDLFLLLFTEQNNNNIRIGLNKREIKSQAAADAVMDIIREECNQ